MSQFRWTDLEDPAMHRLIFSNCSCLDDETWPGDTHLLESMPVGRCASVGARDIRHPAFVDELFDEAYQPIE